MGELLFESLGTKIVPELGMTVVSNAGATAEKRRRHSTNAKSKDKILFSWFVLLFSFDAGGACATRILYHGMEYDMDVPLHHILPLGGSTPNGFSCPSGNSPSGGLRARSAEGLQQLHE